MQLKVKTCEIAEISLKSLFPFSPGTDLSCFNVFHSKKYCKYKIVLLNKFYAFKSSSNIHSLSGQMHTVYNNVSTLKRNADFIGQQSHNWILFSPFTSSAKGKNNFRSINAFISQGWYGNIFNMALKIDMVSRIVMAMGSKYRIVGFFC